jgi:hypothetical protein
MVLGRGRRDAGPARGLAQRKPVDAAFRDDLFGRANQRRAEVAMMIALTLLRGRPTRLDGVKIAYLGSLIAGFAGGASGGFSSIAEVRQLFQSDHALTAGWIHYLAFDLIVGTLIARDAARAGTPAAFVPPALILTFLFGPVGLLAHLIVRIGQGGRMKESLS